MIEKTLCYDVTNKPLEWINNFCINNDVSLTIEPNRAYIELITIKED